MNVPCSWRGSLSPVQDVGDGWWEGQLPNGQSGLFPEAYVEVSGEVCCVHAYVRVCCVCAYIHVRTYVYLCVLCVCVHTCMYVCVSVCIGCTFMCVDVGVHVLWYMHVHTT